MSALPSSFDGIGNVAPATELSRARGFRMTPPAAARRRNKGTSLEYRLVFSVCFAVFVGVLTLERLIPKSWRKVSDLAGVTSILPEARATAHRYTSIAFQG
jgi:hypothetical protein